MKPLAFFFFASDAEKTAEGHCTPGRATCTCASRIREAFWSAMDLQCFWADKLHCASLHSNMDFYRRAPGGLLKIFRNNPTHDPTALAAHHSRRADHVYDLVCGSHQRLARPGSKN